MASSVSSVYLHVIEDVISKVRDEFVASNVGEDVLGELQAIWEAKMIHCGFISPNMERPFLQAAWSHHTGAPMILMCRPWRSMRLRRPRCSSSDSFANPGATDSYSNSIARNRRYV
ncbi:hypothetical protein HPP92_015543 [Vanilla planifolia]|uniref:Uncharacterized protein n=1 Tax=Vanilla planifolia TaxID=51239 RepID=A0A835QMJ4_VANPL|nr:hypothetical protein HPP92_015543 [Vanilla planifolia]